MRVYDPAQGHRSPEALDDADVVFVCVPTPYTPGHGFDDSHLLQAVRALRGSHTIVIKSTVLPGTTQLLQSQMPQHRFLFNPEFLREATAWEDFIAPDRQIVGWTAASQPVAQDVMDLLPRAPFERICLADEAEMAKYVANSFLAIKVSYANEVFDLCSRLHIDYDSVRAIVGADARIGDSHFDVHDNGYRGYGGKCLPKDSKTLLDLARSVGLELAVLGAADEVNESLRAAAVDPPANLTVLAGSAPAAERAA